MASSILLQISKLIYLITFNFAEACGTVLHHFNKLQTQFNFAILNTFSALTLFAGRQQKASGSYKTLLQQS